MFSLESQPQAYTEKHEKMLEKHSSIVVEMVKNLSSKKFEQLGKGNVGEVMSAGKSHKVCLKFVSPETVSEDVLANSLKREADLQDKIHSLNIEGVKVPKPYWTMSMESEEGKIIQVFAMETINGASIHDVFNNEGVDLPDNFNLQEFISKLSNFVREINERNIYHKDLHYGNVMVDFETGDPVVIDFGKATETFASENPYRDQVLPNGEVRYQRDETWVREIGENLGAYLTNKKK